MTTDQAATVDDRLPVRGVLGFGILTGVAMSLYFLFLAPETPLAWDFIAYYEAAGAALRGEPFIGHEPAHAGGEYVYPPIVVVAFLPYAAVSLWETAFIVHGLVNLAALVALGYLCLDELDHLDVSLEPLDRYLILAFAVASLYPLVSIGLGQVDPIVAVLIAAIFVAIDRGHDAAAGLALAAAAVIKLFPAAFGVWLLWHRRWRSAAIATAAGGTAVIASLVLFGVDTNRRYIELILFERSRLQDFATGMSPDFFAVSLVRPISAVFPGAPPVTYLVVALALVAPPLAFVVNRASSPVDIHVAYLAVLVGILIALPSTNLNHFLYLYFPAVVLLYAFEAGPARRWLLFGMAVLLVPIQPAVVVTTMSAVPVQFAAPATIHLGLGQLWSVASVALIGAIIVLIGCVRYALTGVVKSA